MFRKIVEQSIENGFFDEVTEDVLNDEEQFDAMVEVFLDEIINNLATSRFELAEWKVYLFICRKG